MISKVLIFFGFLIFLLGCTSPPDEIYRAIFTNETKNNQIEINNKNIIPINPLTSFFEFEGYGPANSHIGSFEIWDGFLILENYEIVGAYGSIDASSVKTDSLGLDRHLRSSDFFDVANYPEINIFSKSIDNNIMTAELNFHGIKKDIQFPVEITNDPYSISSEFIFSMKEFNISYIGVNDEVRIKFKFKN